MGLSMRRSDGNMASNTMPKAMQKALKDAGWIREDTYYWKHPGGGRFYPYTQDYGLTVWRMFWDKGEVPPSDYHRLEL